MWMVRIRGLLLSFCMRTTRTVDGALERRAHRQNDDMVVTHDAAYL